MSFQKKHTALIKQTQDNDAEYASIYGTDELHDLIHIVLQTEEEELKKLVELQSCDKTMIPMYKKNLKLFAEYYLTDRDNRSRVKAIKEKEFNEKSQAL